jgi:chromosome segregation ATPase
VVFSSGIENDEDIQALERELQDIHNDTSTLQSDLDKLRSDITLMETTAMEHDEENNTIIEKTNKLNQYLLHMKQELIHSLQSVKLPNMSEPLIEDNFETYLNNLRSLCIENCAPENKVLFSAVKQAVANIQILQ